MKIQKRWLFLSLLLVAALMLVACGGGQATTAPATEEAMQPTPEEVGGFQIPAIEEGKFNVAMVLIGPHDDGGW